MVEPLEKEIVWAKIKGFPWWPAIIKNVSYQFRENHIKGLYKERIYEIDFIGSKSHAIVSKNSIQSFMKNYEGHCETKSISLKKAIKLAKKLFEEKNGKKSPKTDQKTKIEKFSKLENDESKTESEKNEDNLLVLDSQKSNNLLNKKRRDHSDSLTDSKNHDDLVDRKELLKSENNDIYKNKNIKISININLDNNKNCQKTFNINSTMSDDIGAITTKKMDKDSTRSVQSEPNSSRSKKSKKNLQKIKNSDIQESFDDLDFDVDCLENIAEKKNNANENKKIDKKENISNENYDQSDREDEENFENDDDYIFLNKIIKNLANYQIQSSNIMNKKIILEDLENLQKKIEELQNKDKVQQYEDTDVKLYTIYKELVPLLDTFTYSKIDEILNKSSEILSNITENVIKDLFILNENDLNELILISNVEVSDTEDIFKLISEKNKTSKKKNNIDSSNGSINDILSKDKSNDKNNDKNNDRNNDKNNNKNNDKNNDNSNDNNKNKNNNKKINYKSIGENLINIINNNINGKCINEFNYISEDFFKNIYNKSNNGLDKNMASKRKHVCIKLLYLLKKTIPNSEEDFLKKIIIFLEYKIRNEDPTLGTKYNNKVEEISKKIKNCLKIKKKI